MNGKHKADTSSADRQRGGFDRSNPRDWLRAAGIAGAAVAATTMLHHASHPKTHDEPERLTGAVLSPDAPMDARQFVQSLETEPMPQMVTYVLDPHDTKAKPEK
jgi:hypothetical protein